MNGPADALDRLVPLGTDLLERVDAALMAHGLPAGHPIIEQLRRLGALPADALRAIAARRSAPLRAAAAELRRTADEYEQQADLLATPAQWTGPAGERFAAHRASLAAHLGDTTGAGGAAGADAAGLSGRLRATAAHLDEIADWVDGSRLGMARAVADVLGSAEAVTMRTDGDTAAAAAIGARILAAAGEALSSGRAIAERWSGRLGELTYRSPDVTEPAVITGSTRLMF
jgi:hypothetical protein